MGSDLKNFKKKSIVNLHFRKNRTIIYLDPDSQVIGNTYRIYYVLKKYPCFGSQIDNCL